MFAKNQNPVLTVKDAAEYLNLSEMTILRLANQGLIPGWKIGRQWRFSREVLVEHLKNKNAPTGGKTHEG